MEIICKNCGGKFDKDELVCPYCGFENYEQAFDEQQDYIEDYKKKTKELKKEPKRLARFSGKIILLIFVVILTLFLIALAVAAVIRERTGDDKNLSKHKEDVAVLEEYYNQMEYQNLYDYMEGMDNRYSDSYEKYYIIYRMYDDYIFVDEQAADCARLYEEFRYENDGENLVYSLYLCCDNLNKLKEFRENGYVYGEEEVAKDFEKKFKYVMSNHLKMTEEEIDEAINMYEGSLDTYKDTCKELARRMIEGGSK
ncbi:MAG: hypothetical protein E7270_05100 [Lachnospiraceae bacterium]|nr:hypothetical protein [Lachnospiraceae bacterium]